MWMSRTVVEARLDPAPARPVAIAVPARDEAERIAACLAALDAAAAFVPGPVTVVVLVNNSRDATARVAREFAARDVRIVVVETVLPPAQAHAGGARRAAMDRAAAVLPADGVVMTTDADSRVDADWIAANLAELRRADAVAGVVTFDAATFAALPPLPVRALEWRLAELHAQLADLIDPRPYDPWPSHLWAWGASLALTRAAYDRVGGCPLVPLAEDRALAAAVERADLRLRHSHAPVVFTSARREGRATGGFADLLRDYCADGTTLCDAALEPTADLVRRLARRAALRGAFAGEPGFGAAWAAADRAPRSRLAPADLAAEVKHAERLVSRQARAARRSGTAASAPDARSSPMVPARGTPPQPPRRSADSRVSARASGPA